MYWGVRSVPSAVQRLRVASPSVVNSASMGPKSVGAAVFMYFLSGKISLSKLELGLNGIEYTFTGFDFFKRAFVKDASFLPKLLESLGFICYATPIIVIIALLLALMLKNDYKGRGIFRTIFFMPVVIMSGPIISELLGKYSNIILLDDENNGNLF